MQGNIVKTSQVLLSRPTDPQVSWSRVDHVRAIGKAVHACCSGEQACLC